MKIVCLYLALGFIYQTHCFTFDKLFTNECTNRYEFRHEIPKVFPYLHNCTYVREVHPICRKKIVVSYSEHPPYVIKNYTTGRVVGLLPGMLRLAMETCCFHCAQLEFIGPFEMVEKYFQNATLIMPVESASESKQFIGMDYISFIDVPGVSFLAKETSGKAAKLTRHLFKSVLNTWPLFLTAFFMAIIAGCVVWVLDTWFNRYEFPSSFPRGPFEGFWWAFVSMTTVGYGDRAPKSVIARLFAVVWIMLGITIFSMYTATLTSALSMNVEELSQESMFGLEIGVLNTTAAGESAVIQEGAEPIYFRDLQTMLDGLVSEQVHAMAVDDNIATYQMTYFKQRLPDIREHLHKIIKHNSYGLVSMDENVTIFLRTFFENNEDHRITLLSHLKNHEYDCLQCKVGPSVFVVPTRTMEYPPVAYSTRSNKQPLAGPILVLGAKQKRRHYIFKSFTGFDFGIKQQYSVKEANTLSLSQKLLKAPVNKVDTTQFFSANSPIFASTMIALVILGVVTIIIGLACKWYFKQHQDILRTCVKFQDKKDKYKQPDVELSSMIKQDVNLDEEFFRELDALKEKWRQRHHEKSVGNGNGNGNKQ